MSGAIVACFFDVVFFGQRWNQGGSSSDLADAFEDDFGAAVVEFDGSADFDGAAGETADVSYILQIVGEDDYREGAGHLVFAEVEEVDAFGADFDAEDFAGHALGFAYVLSGFVDGEAVGSEHWWSRQEQHFEQGFRCVAAFHASILGKLPHTVRDGKKKMCRTLPEWDGASTAWACRSALSIHCAVCPPVRQTGIDAAVTTLLLVPLVGAFGSGGAKATTARASGPTVVQLTTYG